MDGLLIFKGGSRRPASVPLPQQSAFIVSLSPSNPTRSENSNVGDPRQRFPLEIFPFVSSWDQQRSHGDAGSNLSGWPSFCLSEQPSSSAPALAGQYSWSTDQQCLSMSITACQDGCTSHSAEVHHAIRTLQAYRSAQDGWSSTSWSQGQEISAWTLVPAVFTEPDSLSWPISDVVQGLGRTLSARTMPNQELLMVCKSGPATLCICSFEHLSDISRYHSHQLSVPVHGFARRKSRTLEPVYQVLRPILCQLSALGMRGHLFSCLLPHRHWSCRQNCGDGS